MKGKLLLILGLFCVSTAFPQNYREVVARSGDGIFSMLRNEGLDPVAFYGKFIELNKDKLGEGSALKLGETYLIPIVESEEQGNFSDRAVLVRLGDTIERPLLKGRFSKLRTKSDKLEEAVIYLISAYHPKALNQRVWEESREINLKIAEELVENGAKVYLIESPLDSLGSLEETPTSAWVPTEERAEYSMAPSELMSRYVDAINTRYLKNSGAYQRVLLTRLDGPVRGSSCDIRIMHYRESRESKLVARKLKEMFREQQLTRQEVRDPSSFFKNPTNIYLGRNVLAPITLIEFTSNPEGLAESDFRISNDQDLFGRLIASGLREDYARILFEDE